jgi:DNA-binding winged helix-turn-helix (wHTH) protein/WD40 repeat protein
LIVYNIRQARLFFFSEVYTMNGGHGSHLLRGSIRFDPFELDLRKRELRKHGIRIRLQDKSFQLLTALLEEPGEVVSREELQRRLWPAGTVIDYENGLNTAAKRLRAALSDSADEPRFIETVARIGYKLIAPVEQIIEPNGQIVVSDTSPNPGSATNIERANLGLWRNATIFLLLSLAAVAFFLWRRSINPDIRFTQLTFDRGQVSSARFAPDGHSVIYAAQWGQNPRSVFVADTASPESRRLGFSGANIATVSHLGELGLLTQQGVGPIMGSVLSRVPINGASPVDVDRNIMSADWSSDGASFAVVRAVDGVNQLEFPAGHALYRTSGWLGSVRVSPANDAIAFFEYPLRHDDAGHLAIVDLKGAHRTLTEQWSSASGLAWHPATGEIWFTASRDSGSRDLLAATRSSKIRVVGKMQGGAVLRDVASDGRVLVSRDNRRLEMTALLPGESDERDISWLDWSRAVDISKDGSLILFDESGTASGGKYISYLYRSVNHSMFRLGDGLAMGFAPDNDSALLLNAEDRKRLRLVPLARSGADHEIEPSGLEYQWAKFFPDGKTLLAFGSEPGARLRLYRVSMQRGIKPVPISPPTATRNAVVSPDGGHVAVLDSSGKLVIYSTDGSGSARVIPSADPFAPILWPNADVVYVQRQKTFSDIPAVVYRLNPENGRMQEWKRVAPKDSVGVNAITRILISGDQKSYVYSSRRVLSELVLVDGWR